VEVSSQRDVEKHIRTKKKGKIKAVDKQQIQDRATQQ
jgi:hypothetical protein